MHPRVWEASGHVAGFTDPLIDCRACKARFRADQMESARCPRKPSRMPGEYDDCALTEPRQFNLMFKTFMGPVEDSAAAVYLRPETAQGSYVNFHNVVTSTRQRVPFGIAQIGKAFRNEITPGNFIFRTREFEQMEMQFFVEPGTDDEWFEFWKAQRMEWIQSLGIRPEKLRFEEHGPDALAHYAKRAYDIQYEFPFGWQEFEGVHNRTDFDLRRHQEYSGRKQEYVYPIDRNKRYLPYVIETAVGVGRVVLAALVDAYHEEEVEGETRVVLRLDPRLAPVKVAVLPLVKKDGMPEMAERIQKAFRAAGINSFYDDSGSIGKRYRRLDEAGTPFAITVDGESLSDNTVTVRDRDTLKQERVGADSIVDYVRQRIG
jgi:glycyl-tRNA synthetase